MHKKFTIAMFILLTVVVTPSAFAEYDDTIVIIETQMGRLIMEFFPNEAPNHVSNFVKLSEDGFYTGTIFHRIIEGFMIQGGDPKTASPEYSLSEWGTGDPGYSIDAEFNQMPHERGIVSMARSADPNSAGSQFFIVHKDSNFLDGQYTVFGRILTDESFETLDKIATMPTAPNDQPLDAWKVIISDVQVLNRSELSNLPEFSPPSITDIVPMSTASQKQEFPNYGISFNSPVGWMVQTPPQTTLEDPNIVIVGPKIADSVPAIAIKVVTSKVTLEGEIDKLRNKITPLIEQNVLEVTREQMIKINDYDAYVLKAVGHFEGRDEVEQNIGFAQVLILENKILYSLQYSNDVKTFDDNEDHFKELLNTLEIYPIEKRPVGADSDEGGYDGTLNEEGGGCLIATAAYGSEMAPQVQFLREIRDGKVMATQSGTAFMTGFNQFYYSFSPAVADYERENPAFKEAVKVTLTPLLTSLTLLNYVDVDTEQEILGYGIGIILLNIGMYFVAPAAAIIAIKNRIKQQ